MSSREFAMTSSISKRYECISYRFGNKSNNS